MARYFLKLVYAVLHTDKPPVLYSQNVESAFRVRYEPGEWTEPTLQGSKLFIYQNMKEFDATRLNKGYPTISVPYMGVMLWWCEAMGAGLPKQSILIGPPDRYIELYWRQYPNNIASQYPDIYTRKYYKPLFLFADAVKLIAPVNQDEYARMYA